VKLRPLRDLVVVRKFTYTHPTLYTAGIHLHRGEVIAVGPGRRERRKVAYRRNENNPDEVTYFEDGDETGKVTPVPVKVGDVVEYGFRGTTHLPGTDLVLVRARSIYGIAKDDSKHVAVFDARSAPVPI
jgi:co-chaperonin GroES (HSP10)